MEPGESAKGGRCHENEIHGLREKRQTLLHSKRIKRVYSTLRPVHTRLDSHRHDFNLSHFTDIPDLGFFQ